jgi:glycolate oxidase iron-sulfur subunit
LSAGDTATFQHLVRHNLDQINKAPFDYLVTACATCTATIREMWPLMLHDASKDLLSQATALAEKTLDISQFLVDQSILLPTGTESVTRPNPVPVSYHDPCHLKKTLGIASQPRDVLRATGGYRMVEMRAPDQCCGMGGSFNLKYYGISSQIGQRKRESIRDAGCRVVATSCPACMLQITDALSQAHDPVEVKHVIELYAESLK